jgi:PAS domain-containing protein
LPDTPENQLPVGTWHFDVANELMMVDANTLKIFGRDEYDGTVATFFSYVHAEDQSAVSEAIRNTLESGAHYKVIYRIVLPNGSDRKVIATGSAVRDDSGKIAEVSGICEVCE